MQQDSLSIRQKAEELLRNKKSSLDLSEIDTLKLIHELEVHQIELELLNEELLLAKEKAETAAKKAEAAAEKYTDLYDFAPSGYFTLSKEGNIIGLNLCGSQMIGKERSLLINIQFGFFVTEETRPIFNSFLKEVFFGKADEVCEVCLSANEDFPKYVRLSGIGDEKIEQCYVTAIDITEQKKAQKALASLVNQALFQLTSDGIHILDENGNVVEANDSFCKLLGYSREEILKMNVSDWDAKFTKKELLKKIGELIANPGVFTTKQRYRGGGVRDVEINAVGIVIEGHKYLCASARDITERIKSEDLLRQTRQNYETFFNTIDEFLFVLDEQGNIIHFNSTVIDRLGYTREELIGSSVLMVHPPERRNEAGRIVGEMLSGTTEFCPVPIITKAGVYIPVETRVTTGHWDGKPAIFGVTKDISQIALSEEKFSKVFYLNPSACGLSDVVTGKYVEVNEAFCSLFGYKKDEVIGKTADELGILTLEAKQDILKNADKNGKITNIETDLIAKDGKIKNVLISAEYLNIQDKTLRYTVVNDITERRHAEDELRSKTALLEAQMNATIDGILIVDENQKIILLNQRFIDLFNVPSHLLEDDEDAPMLRYFVSLSKYPDKFYERVKYLYEHNTESGRDEVEFKSGMIFERYSAPVIGKDAKLYGRIWLFRDITERRQMEEAVRASEAKHTSMIANISDVIGIMGIDGIMKYKSPNIEKLFGWQARDLVGTNGWETVHPDDLERIQKEFYSLLEKDDQTTTVVYRYKCKDGSYKPIELTAKNLGNDPIIGGVILNYRDITERKRMEDEIIRTNLELHRANSAKDKFFSIIAHDLRSPFQGLLGLSEIMSADDQKWTLDEFSQFSKALRVSIVNLYKLVENLLEWAMFQKGAINFLPVELSFSDIFLQCKRSIEERAKQKGITIFHQSTKIDKIYADEKMISTVLRNLLTNAVKFTERGGKVTVRANETRDGMIEISVTDTGVGIPDDVIDKLFIVGEKVGTTGTDDEPSTGLGLILCKEFVEKHGGKIWVESKEGVGSTFYFTIQKVG